MAKVSDDAPKTNTPSPTGVTTKREIVDKELQRLAQIGEQARSRRSRFRIRLHDDVIVIRMG